MSWLNANLQSSAWHMRWYAFVLFFQCDFNLLKYFMLAILSTVAHLILCVVQYEPRRQFAAARTSSIRTSNRLDWSKYWWKYSNNSGRQLLERFVYQAARSSKTKGMVCFTNRNMSKLVHYVCLIDLLKKPLQWNSWAFLPGPTMPHYWCWKIYIPEILIRRTHDIPEYILVEVAWFLSSRSECQSLHTFSCLQHLDITRASPFY